MNQAEYIQTIIEMVRDQHSVIDDAARARTLQMALMRYSGDMPQRLSVELQWAITGYAANLPEDWEVSDRIDRITLASDGQPIEQYAVLETISGFELVLHDRSLPEGVRVRIDYTRPYQPTTVAAGHQQAVCAYAAHLLCLQLAAYFSGEREAAVGADHSQTESRARNYAARAKEYRAMYFAALGIADPAIDGAATKAVAGIAAWPRRNPRHRLVNRGSLW